jgi:methionyl-tRNA formyltransferase
MRIAFYVMGKKGYTVLAAFLSHYGSDKVAFVVSSKDKGVDNDWYEPSVKLCDEYNVVFLNRNQDLVRNQNKANYLFAIGWKWMINDSKNLIVFHDSLLPKYRGFSPLVNMLINGETKIGVTAILASEEYDKGPIIHQESVKVDYPIKIGEAIEKILPVYINLAIKISQNLLASQPLQLNEQNEKVATYSLWRNQNDYQIDWTLGSDAILRFVNALGSPYTGAITHTNGILVKIIDAEVIGDVFVENRVSHIGKIIFFIQKDPVVVCGKGLLKITNSISEVAQFSFRTKFESNVRI